LDFSLVSTKYFDSEILPLAIGAQGPIILAKKTYKPTLLMISLTKTRNPKQFFFHCKLEDSPSLLSVWTVL